MSSFSFKDYRAFVEERCRLSDPRERMFLGAMGLAGEAGEVSELFQKHLLHGKPLDRDALIKELGDVLWYFTLILINHDITLGEVALENVKKLMARDKEEPDRYGQV